MNKGNPTINILLVIGNVPEKQLTIVKGGMLRLELSHEVVRIDTKLSSESDFIFAAFDEGRKNGISDSDIKRYSESEAKKLKERVISESFGGFSIDDVKVVVWEALREDESSFGKMSWLTDKLPLSVMDYTVMIGNDGSYWLQGEGLGDLVTS